MSERGNSLLLHVLPNMFKKNVVEVTVGLLLLYCCINSASSTEDDDMRGEHKRIITEVFKNEEISIFRPNLHGTPVDVECYILLQSFGDINAMSMDYTVDVDFYIRWVDERLRHNTTALVFQTVESIKKFWLPDLYFENEKSGALHSVLSENIALLLEPDGNITYSTRLTLTLSCHMELELFPLDVQLCRLRIKSYAYNSDHVVLHWKMEKPIIKNDDITMPQYELTGEVTWSGYSNMPLGNFSTLIAEFRLERSLGFFIINSFLPSILLVIISWISFWLHVDATPARASLGITSVLTLVTQAGSLRYMIPSLSYPTAMDLWFTSCIIFVFAALLEFSMVNYFYVLSVRASKKEIALGIPDDEDEDEEPDERSSSFEMRTSYHPDNNVYERSSGRYQIENKDVETKKKLKGEKYRKKCKLYLKTAENIDKTCRVLFPSLFGTFAFLFWIIYRSMRGDSDLQF